ncbi:alanine racemase [Lonsdalea iberica]|uniref:Alanine racemase n=1 Tax=Lonsdalea iberica TaxID=1082703 RepID=A0A1X3S170_9GAMM|nr:alanine racemase [Lonsdalea iberica]OSN08223.1 alanine racemase [Lonsdalea iberica]
MQTATAVINRRALRHNLQVIRQRAPNSRLVAIVKANAYGHGALEAARTLGDADAFGVARLSEALALRAGGITHPILLLEGFFSAEELPLLAAKGLETAVHSIEQLEALEQATLERPLTVWMKLDTGMHRLGVRPDQACDFWQRLSRCHNVVQPVNIMSHFCRADEPEVDVTKHQLATFDAVAAGRPGAQSIAASGGILLWPQSHRDQIRPGIVLYGVSPLDGDNAARWGLQPAMRLTSHLIAVREHHSGEPVGYGSTWTSPRDTRLGVVAMGYGDGYPRCAKSGTPVWVNGREVPLAGRVSMDMITVDLGPESRDRVGDKVELWGKHLPIESVAAVNDVSAYELLTRLTSRTEIVYTDEPF